MEHPDMDLLTCVSNDIIPKLENVLFPRTLRVHKTLVSWSGDFLQTNLLVDNPIL